MAGRVTCDCVKMRDVCRLMLVLLLCCTALASSVIHICSRPVWEKMDVMEGDLPVVICCDYCRRDNSISTNDSLTLLPGKVNFENETGTFEDGNSQVFEVRRPSACRVELSVVTLSQSKLSLVCRLNGDAVDLRDLEVIPKPPLPKILKVTSTPTKTITVEFDRGTRGLSYRDNYTVTMTELLVPSINKTVTVTLCSLQQTPVTEPAGLTCPQGERICVCRYNNTNNRYYTVRDVNVVVYVRVERISLRVETNSTQNLVDHIQPEMPLIAGVDLVSPHQATVKICQPQYTHKVNTFMITHGAPLRYLIVLQKKNEMTETVSAELIARDMFLPCASVDFPKLTAFTRYTLKATLIGAEEGPSALTDFVTAKTVPAYPPVLENFGFSRWSQDSGLTVVWQPLPQSAQSGSEVTYDLEVWSGRDLAIRESNITGNYWMAPEPLPKNNLTVRVWSRNELGKSENFSSLDIPSVADTESVPFLVEVTEKSFRVLLKPEVGRTYKQMLVHMCQTFVTQRDFEACSSPPQTVSLTLASTAGDYTLYLNPPSERVTLANRTLQYYFSSDNHSTGDVKTVIAELEKQFLIAPTWSDTFSDLQEGEVTGDFKDTSGDGMIVEDYWRETDDEPIQNEHLFRRSATFDDLAVFPVRKRFSPGTNWQLDRARADIGPQDLGMRRRLLSESSDLDLDGQTTATAATTQENARIGNNNQFYRVYVSAETNDGRWLGMSSADCYFTQQSSIVEVIISQETNPKWDFIVVRWRQACDRNPRQFLAEAYQISVSSDESCKKNVSLIGEVMNSMFQPMRMQIPLNSSFVCIRAFRTSPVNSEPRFLSQAAVKSIEKSALEPSDSSSRNAILIPSIVTAVVMALLLALFVCVRRCRQNLVKLASQEIHIQRMLDGVEDDDNDGADPNQPLELAEQSKWTSQQSGLATDSGQGTLYGQDSRGSNSSKKSSTHTGDSNSVASYTRQGQKRVQLQLATGSDDSRDVDDKVRRIDLSNTTSNGDDWLDSSVPDGSSHSGLGGVRRLPVPMCDSESEAADWLDSSAPDSGQSSQRGGDGILKLQFPIADGAGADWSLETTGGESV